MLCDDDGTCVVDMLGRAILVRRFDIVVNDDSGSLLSLLTIVQFSMCNAMMYE